MGRGLVKMQKTTRRKNLIFLVKLNTSWNCLPSTAILKQVVELMVRGQQWVNRAILDFACLMELSAYHGASRFAFMTSARSVMR